MGGELLFIDAGVAGKLLQELAAAAARQMAFNAIGGEEPARGLAAAEERGARREIGGERLTRRLAQRHQPLLPPLAAHDEEAPVAARRGERQAHELGDAQARAVQQLEKAGEAQPFGARHLPRGVEELPRLLLADELRQRAAQARRVERGGGIVAANALEDEEAIELPERRETARRAARREAGARELREVAAEIGGRGLFDGAAEKAREILEIVAIRHEGQLGGAAFGGEHFEKGLDMTRGRRRCGVATGGRAARHAGQIPAASAASTATARASASSPTDLRPATTRPRTIGSPLNRSPARAMTSVASTVSPSRLAAAACCWSSQRAALGIVASRAGARKDAPSAGLTGSPKAAQSVSSNAPCLAPAAASR